MTRLYRGDERCQVVGGERYLGGETVLHYDARRTEDLYAMLKAAGDRVELGGNNEPQEPKARTVEVWGRSEENKEGRSAMAENNDIVCEREPEGNSTRVELRLGDRGISRLWIVPFTLRVGRAVVRMDGIGGVGTDEEHRNRGHSRRVLEAAVERMRSGDAALSMLYGIRDFYPKFGFATAGPDHIVLLTDLQRDSDLPSGWSVRGFEAHDLPAVQALYDTGTAEATGAAVRPTEGAVWSNLMRATDGSGQDACRVVVGPDGRLHGYVWRARWCWYVAHTLETNIPNSLVLGEVMADGPAAADAVLAACRIWAREEGEQREVKQVVLAFPPEGPLSAAAMRQDARFTRNYSACGGSMARVLDVARLLKALRPELQARLQATQSTFPATLTLRTDIGTATLRIARSEIEIEEGEPEDGSALTVELPQAELARLALGAFPPGDLLARLPAFPEAAKPMLEALFPQRNAHMHLPDRY